MEDLRLYSKKIKFNYSDFDTNDNILPNSILSYFQDIAGEHANLLNVGYLDLLKNNYIWVLDKIRFEIIKDIKLNEDYLIQTWPLKASILQFQREFNILDKDNNIVIKASSIWCVLDINSRKLVRTKNIQFNINEYLENKSFDDGFILFKPVDISTYKKGIFNKVSFSQLDHNKHMNNVKYSILAIDSIPDILNLKIKQMQINFQKECVFKDNLQTYYNNENNEYNIIGIKNESITSFICNIKFDKIN